jgi:hypothetical protein
MTEKKPRNKSAVALGKLSWQKRVERDPEGALKQVKSIKPEKR